MVVYRINFRNFKVLNRGTIFIKIFKYTVGWMVMVRKGGERVLYTYIIYLVIISYL